MRYVNKRSASLLFLEREQGKIQKGPERMERGQYPE